jgi:ATP-dependent Lon protease
MSDKELLELLRANAQKLELGAETLHFPGDSPEIRALSEDDLEIIECPVLPVRDTVIFPHIISPLFVLRERSLRAVNAASEDDSPLIVVTQRDPLLEEPEGNDLYHVGTAVVIARMLRMPDGSTSILTQGHDRVEILEYLQFEPYMMARARVLPEPVREGVSTEALMRAVLAIFERVVQFSRNVSEDAYVMALNIDDPSWLADLVASTVELDTKERQNLLSTLDPIKRLERLSILLAKELDVLELENRIQSKVQQEVDKSQREFFLREQMKAIQTELGEEDAFTQEVNELRERLEAIDLPEQVEAKAEKELSRLAAMPPHAPERGIIRTYLDWIIELPWTEATEDNQSIKSAARILDESHYGLEKAKERILEQMAVRQLAGDRRRSPILCFVGPPGTGKTSLGRAIAQALGRKFVRVSLGGVRDEAEIRGHRRTYIGALPGRIIQTMRRAETINPVFMLDEIDKLGADFRGDPSAALLEVLDPEQNHAFSDHYLDVDYDLSQVMFITTANVLYTIPPALQDRMEVIEFPGYIEEEKLGIAHQFLIPRQLQEHGLSGTPLRFSEAALRDMIREYTYEAGVRNLEREIASICRKVARTIAEGKPAPQQIIRTSLAKYLGPPKYLRTRAEREDRVGVATGIVWTEAGGDLIPVEVSLMKGKGTLMLTGQLGDVMQESAHAALSYARANARSLDIPKIVTHFDKMDIHIHVPEGAIPKDGPSAGITMATALISAVSKRPVRHDVGMTGEITLRGRVLAIGGFKEKVLAAHRAGLKTVIVPQENQRDMAEIPRNVKRRLEFVFVNRMEEVLATALLKKATQPDQEAEQAQ